MSTPTSLVLDLEPDLDLVHVDVQPPGFLPDMDMVARLFNSHLLVNLAWVHLLLLDFYQAR